MRKIKPKRPASHIKPIKGKPTKGHKLLPRFKLDKPSKEAPFKSSSLGKAWAATENDNHKKSILRLDP